MFLTPIKPPYDPLEWSRRPFAEKSRMVCNAWTLQGYGTPLGVYLVYALKILFYVGGWILFCRFTPGMGHLHDFGAWWLRPEAFQKAILWSLLFEGVGLGCGSGPLTARYFPPLGGVLYFLRPGTTNANCPATLIEEVAAPDAEGAALIRDAAEAMRLSARGFHRTLRVARTLADLDGEARVRRMHLAEALSYRARGG